LPKTTNSAVTTGLRQAGAAPTHRKPKRKARIAQDCAPPLLAEIPWGHHLLLLNKITNPAASLYYLHTAAHLGWSRSVLLNQVKAGAWERAVTERKAHNFARALPTHLAEQAEEALKSRYNLEFLGVSRALHSATASASSAGSVGLRSVNASTSSTCCSTIGF
jgi:hypothetical protein